MEEEAGVAFTSSPQTPASVGEVEDYYPLISVIAAGQTAGEEESRRPGDVYTQLAQKEHDLELAAELGKALLSKNNRLTANNERLAADFNQKLEELSQEKHELELRLESAEARYASVVRELQSDVSRLREELQQQQAHTQHGVRTTAHELREHADQSEQLTEQLLQATDRERRLRDDVDVLRETMRSGRTSLQEQGRQLESVRDEMRMLTAQRADLERRVSVLTRERDGQTASTAEAEQAAHAFQAHRQQQQQRLLVQEREISELQEHNLTLQDRLRLLAMHVSPAAVAGGDTAAAGESLYRELRRQLPASFSLDSLDQRDISSSAHSRVIRPNWLPVSQIYNPDHCEWDGDVIMASGTLSADSLDQMHMMTLLGSPIMEDVESFQLKQELVEVYAQLRQMVHELRRLASPDGTVAPAPGGQPDADQPRQALRAGTLVGLLAELRGLMECIVNGQLKHAGPAECGQLDVMLHQVDLLHVELTEAHTQLDRLQMSLDMRDLELRRKNDELSQLSCKVKLSLHHQELRDLQQERDHIHDRVAGLSRDDVVDQARRSRDDAVVKRNVMEIELERAKLDLMDLDGQLKEAIDQKLQLSQQLEQWKMDMQELVDTQMNKRMELEAKKSDKKPLSSPSGGAMRRKFKLFS